MRAGSWPARRWARRRSPSPAPRARALDYTINGVSGQKAIERQIFGPADATPVATYGDLWWGGAAQNGWGVAISQQYRTLFAVWYTYDASGHTVWYVLPGGSWSTAEYLRRNRLSDDGFALDRGVPTIRLRWCHSRLVP